MTEILNDSNFLLYAAKYYDNPQCYDIEEFESDLKRFKYLKRLLKKYSETGDLKDRLILNHIVILYNVFGPFATNMLFFKLREYQSLLKPFIILLNYLPDKIYGIEEKPIYTSEIAMDQNVINILRRV